jgi:hypothetical protein
MIPLAVCGIIWDVRVMAILFGSMPLNFLFITIYDRSVVWRSIHSTDCLACMPGLHIISSGFGVNSTLRTFLGLGIE